MPTLQTMYICCQYTYIVKRAIDHVQRKRLARKESKEKGPIHNSSQTVPGCMFTNTGFPKLRHISPPKKSLLRSLDLTMLWPHSHQTLPQKSKTSSFNPRTNTDPQKAAHQEDSRFRAMPPSSSSFTLNNWETGNLPNSSGGCSNCSATKLD